MFAYYLDLALRSLKRNRGLTALMIITIGFGVAASMTTWSVFRAVSGDPIPRKSAKLFVPQIDNWGPSGHAPGSKSTEPPDAMDYTDAMALMRAHRARYQSAIYEIATAVVPERVGESPIIASGAAVYAGFFPMLDVPFRYGSGWSGADDEHRARVIVIGSHLNDQLFDGADSVGKTVNLSGHEYRVAGVLDAWHPQPVFYDVVNTGGFNTRGGDIFIPFTTAIATDTPNNGNTNCNETPKAGFVGLRQSECVWIAFMVQLDNAAAVQDYKQFLDNYAAEQQQAGRFRWPPNTRLRGLMAWLDAQHVVPPDTRISLYVALGLLLVCLVNVMGLLLAKFMRRSSEIGVRRALGASRGEIYSQFLTEAGMVGLAGGVLGLALTWLGVASVGWVLPRDIASLAHMNWSLLLLTLIVAIVTTMLAGLYPTLRAAAVQPAWQLKSN
ncbi:MAG TPA: ABC transporter permease [Rhodanobacteraceae bacterium]|nr:ABC transporter permease [Rhodanobacteraceae bacterium]